MKTRQTQQTKNREIRYTQRNKISEYTLWQKRIKNLEWEEIPYRRTAGCGRVCLGENVAAKLVKNDDGNNAYYSGVMKCASIWTCPVCSATIRQRRSMEIQAAALAWTNNHQGELAMLTLTPRHNRKDSLYDLVDVLRKSWRQIQNRKPWKKIRKLFHGSITALEVTQGFGLATKENNGWHPHLHILFFIKKGSYKDFQALINEWLPAAWVEQVKGNNPAFTPNLENGVNLVKMDPSASGYVSKIANEMTRSDMKGDRSPFGIVDGMINGEKWASPAWEEYAQAMKGRQALVWSPGLKKMLLPEIEEKTDQEIVDEDKGGEVVVLIPKQQWKTMCRKHLPDGKMFIVWFLEQIEQNYDGKEALQKMFCVDVV